MRFLKVYDTGNLNLSSTPTPLSLKTLAVLGHVVGIKIDISASAAGTLTTPASLQNVISGFNLKDSNQVDILPNTISGNDLVTLSYILSPKGVNVASQIPAVSSTNTKFSLIIYIPIAVSEQPVSFQGTLAPYSALAASGATGGTGEIGISWVVEDSLAGVQQTMHIYKFNPTLVTGDNLIGNQLDATRQTIELAANIQADNNLNYITFRSGDQVELDAVGPDYFISQDTQLMNSGHVNGLEILRVTPFTASKSTYFDLNLSTLPSSTTIYQFEV
ncbi:MAG: hypothetical protein QXU98_12575 [Candidatus Parvarchaeota archaeon]